MHSRIAFALVGALCFGLAGAISAPAMARLVGTGTNTVSASYWFPSSSVPPPACDDTTNPNCENEVDSTDNATPTIPANFVQGVSDGSTISVGDTQIVITNELPNTPFCSGALPCSDVFNGFAFSFSSGVDITGVSVDPTSAADFRPITGGLTFAPTEIFVNVVGDAPQVDDKLILDVTTSGVTPPAAPEPSTWAMMLLGFAGLGFAGYRRARASSSA
jgi:PEP-CTERM motif